MRNEDGEIEEIDDSHNAQRRQHCQISNLASSQGKSSLLVLVTSEKTMKEKIDSL
jgi:hypothetical protein